MSFESIFLINVPFCLVPVGSGGGSHFIGFEWMQLEVGRAKSISLTTKSLFFFPQPPLDAFARLGRE